MVNFKCKLCDYETNRKSNLDRHTVSHANKERREQENVTVCCFCSMKFSTKYSCRRHMLLYCTKSQNVNICSDKSQNDNIFVPKSDKNSQNVYIASQNDNVVSPVVNIDTVTETGVNKCEKCYKVFTMSKNLRRHEAVCKGIEHPFQCSKCSKIFSCRQSKSRHEANCQTLTRTDDKAPIVIQDNHGNVHITNIGQQNNVQNITIVNFGQEKIDHITDDMKDKWLKMLRGSGVIKAIEEVHFNPSVPENHNIMFDGNSRKILKVFENDKWSRRASSEITEILISNGRRMLMERYMDSPVFVEDRDTRQIYQDILTTDKQQRPDVYYKIVNQIIAKIIDITEEMIKEDEECKV